MSAMPESSVPAFHVMAKPTGARCNLRCDYCFFLEKERLYPGSDFRMSDEVMEAYIAQTAQAQRVPQVTLAWQGGEPTLMGLDFFRRARAAEEGRVPAGMAVERTLQTNGVLLDDEWCAFLAENDYLVGLSIDGPRELHDAYRHDLGGRPVFDRVVAAARRLQQHGVDVQRALHGQRGQRRPPARGLPLLPRRARRPIHPAHPDRRGRRAARGRAAGHSQRAQRPPGGLRRLPQRGLRRVAAPRRRRDVRADLRRRARRLPARRPRASASSSPPAARASRSSTTATCTRATTSSIRRTCSATSWRRRSASSCAPSSSARSGAPSRRRCPPSAAPASTSSPATASAPRTASCSTPDGEPGLNWLCAGLKAFFAHTERPMRLMAEMLARGGEAREVMALLAEEARTTGRNDPCPCGSGKKYKRCCGVCSRLMSSGRSA